MPDLILSGRKAQQLAAGLHVIAAGALLVLKRRELSETEKRKLTEFPEFSVSALVNGN